MSELEKQFEFYLANLDAIVEEYADRYIVVARRQVVDDFPTEAEARSFAEATLEPDTYTPAAVLQSAESRYTRAAGQLSLQGESDVYVTVEANGLPSEFQVIQPIGAGLDEETLLAASHFTFRAATVDGKPVRSGFLVQIKYDLQP